LTLLLEARREPERLNIIFPVFPSPLHLFWTFVSNIEEYIKRQKEMRKMNRQRSLEKKHELLRNRLDESLQKKRTLELQIDQQFEKLRKLEISLEKCHE